MKVLINKIYEWQEQTRCIKKKLKSFFLSFECSERRHHHQLRRKTFSKHLFPPPLRLPPHFPPSSNPSFLIYIFPFPLSNPSFLTYIFPSPLCNPSFLTYIFSSPFSHSTLSRLFLHPNLLKVSLHLLYPPSSFAPLLSLSFFKTKGRKERKKYEIHTRQRWREEKIRGGIFFYERSRVKKVSGRECTHASKEKLFINQKQVLRSHACIYSSVLAFVKHVAFDRQGQRWLRVCMCVLVTVLTRGFPSRVLSEGQKVGEGSRGHACKPQSFILTISNQWPLQTLRCACVQYLIIND